ncbi:sugar phosphate isomerase/epimerase family protein [Hoeflea sp.]|uniref:sugar phosphate isomerase/epimerase family protein n=1 Tax=Hoeflea sp. TaxID=1940281 RepID=UPI003B0236AC
MELSFQLYSARNFLPWDKVLSTLADLGYTQVEGFGGVYEAPETFRELMEQYGLTMPSGHFGIDALEGDFDGVIARCEALGIRSIFCPYLDADQRPTDAAGWSAFAHRLAAVNERVRATGRRFGWHNHDFEFEKMADGTVPQTVILDEAPEIDWEADIAWIVRGGAEPLDWIEQYGPRITAIHIKDIAPAGQCEDEDGWADVGHGIVAWRNLINALKSSAAVSHNVVEHDNPNDFERFARRSIEALRKLNEVQHA